MHLPGPVRAAVGLAASAADEARRLPDRAIELPMLAVSTALQASLRVQQRYARLAARGEEVLNRRTPTEEPPAWATFDEPVPVDELRSVLGGPDGADDAVASPAPAQKSPAKKAAVKKTAARKTATKKVAARKSAAARSASKTTASRKTARAGTKRVSAPRHTAPSAFDAVGEPDEPAEGSAPAGGPATGT